MGKKSAPEPQPVVPQKPFEMPTFEMPDFSAMMPEPQPQGPSFEEQQAALELQQKTSRRDSLFADRMDAAGTATDYITQLVAQEQSNAALMGLDYEITDEQKTNRINNYFASIWGEGSESELTALMSEVGNPDGFEEFLVTRGDSTMADGASTPGSRDSVSASKVRPVLPEEEDDTLGLVGTALGG